MSVVSLSVHVCLCFKSPTYFPALGLSYSGTGATGSLGVFPLTIIGGLYSCNESSSVRISPNASSRIHVAASLLMFPFRIISVQVPWGFSLSKGPHQHSVSW